MFSKGDNTGRTLRPQQQEVFNWLSANWDKSNIFAIKAPTGAGKSLISKTIQNATGGLILTPDNALIRQYVEEYPDLNVVAGKSHYITQEQYNLCIKRAMLGKPTISNPIAYYQLAHNPGYIRPNVIILDEADQHTSLLFNLIGFSIPIKKGIKLPETLDQVLDYLLKEIKLSEIAIQRGIKNTNPHENKIARYTTVIKEVSKEKHKYTVVTENNEVDGGFNIRLVPVKFPLSFIKSLFNAKLILLSGTLFDLDLKEIVGEEHYLEFECGSPIPVANRTIYCSPIEPAFLNYPMNYYEVAQHLKKLLARFKDLRPCLIHTTYNDAVALKEWIPELIIHTKENKKEVLTEWLANGGILAGAGMSTGLDLKDDLCRLNIVLKGQFPSMADTGTLKRLYIDNTGKEWLENSVLRHVIQSAGRSSRNATDYSATIICDDRLLKVINDNLGRIPNYFREALDFHSLNEKGVTNGKITSA